MDILEKIKKRIIFYGVLENLDNAIKSERISPLTGKIVGALNFNVIINIGNNVVKPIGTAKGYDTALASIQIWYLIELVMSAKVIIYWTR